MKKNSVFFLFLLNVCLYNFHTSAMELEDSEDMIENPKGEENPEGEDIEHIHNINEEIIKEINEELMNNLINDDDKEKLNLNNCKNEKKNGYETDISKLGFEYTEEKKENTNCCANCLSKC